MSTPPGWYTDPLEKHEFRRWDGTSWTAEVKNDDAESTDPLPTFRESTPQESTPQAGAPSGKRWTRNRWLIGLAVFAALAVVGSVYLVAFGHDTPKVSGLALKDAKKQIEASGLSTEVNGTGDDNARVCRQEPDPGERQFSGDPVTVTVGSECTKKPTPSKAKDRADKPKDSGKSKDFPKDPDDVTCRDLRIDRGGSHLPDEASGYIGGISRELPTGTQDDRFQAIAVALSRVCNGSPDERPRKSVVAFASAALIAQTVPGNSPSPDGACVIILASGNKLCGDDAVSYCNAVSARDQDPKSIELCNDILSGRTPTP